MQGLCLFYTQLKHAIEKKHFDCLDLSLFVTFESALFTTVTNNCCLDTLSQWLHNERLYEWKFKYKATVRQPQ